MELLGAEVVAEGLAFPEGPVWLGDGSVVFVEVTAGRLSRVDSGGHLDAVAHLGGGPNGAARGPDGAIYVCNNGGLTREDRSTPSIQRVELDSGRVDVLYTECDGRPLVAPNDLVFDTSGGFWFTDFGGGAIYYASPDGTSIIRVLTHLMSPNGIGLSPDESTLYWAQTHTRQVMRRKLRAPGQVVPSSGYGIQAVIRSGSVDPEALLVGLPGGQELDSLAIDSSGAICVGTLIESGITVVSPDGTSVLTHTLPEHLADPAVTNLCFGGPDHRTAFVTASMTGRLISCRWPRRGLRLAFQD